ncbi:hypothetical protein [Selenomonas sp. AE3005]|uniref:hypothetical protein n=1 Tax=Selenomonas sp. AE3005 TaxID=1485543 RepID=UPI0025D81C2C|nr:hypothetical protein [Selenomonas sp. AE3005]
MIRTQTPKGVLRNCPLCGKLFSDTGFGYCQKCYDKSREYENQINEFVKAHPHCTIKDIVKQTKIPMHIATSMINKGQFIAGGKISYPCSRCGRMITTGLYCSNCMDLVHQATANAKRLEIERRQKEEQARIKKKFEKERTSGLNILKILRGK